MARATVRFQPDGRDLSDLSTLDFRLLAFASLMSYCPKPRTVDWQASAGRPGRFSNAKLKTLSFLAMQNFRKNSQRFDVMPAFSAILAQFVNSREEISA